MQTSAMYNFQIDQMQLGLPSRDYFLHPDSDRDLGAYHNYMTDVAVILGAQPEQAASQLWDVIQFEKQLANVRQTIMDFWEVDCLGWTQYIVDQAF